MRARENTGEAEIQFGNDWALAEEVEQEILIACKQALEKEYGKNDEDIQYVIITVPRIYLMCIQLICTEASTFEFKERTIEMAKNAGFTVLSLFSEPAASAVYYWYTTLTKEKKSPKADTNGNIHVVLYDFGGGTFDCVYMLLQPDGQISMVSSSGCNYTGGEDLDISISRTFAAQIEATTGI
jgi:molecular chaperone DnaK (HSP70)